MNLKTVLLLFISIFFIQNYCFADPQNIRYQTHVVDKGETVFSISKKYGVSVDDMYNANPDAAKGIKEHQLLRIPSIRQEVVSVQSGGNVDYILHSVQPNETLYSVSKKYNVSVEDIMNANSGLSINNFRIGTAIRIPKSTRGTTEAISQASVTPVSNEIRHKVVSKETLYSISKRYNVSMEDIANANPEIISGGLRKDMVLTIPSKTQKEHGFASANYATINSTSNSVSVNNTEEVLKVGLLLPFLNIPERQQARFVEFYEGFLLAVEDLKAKGYSAEIFVFDIRKGGNSLKLNSLLETSEMKDLDLIIGGVTDEEIAILSRFADANNIKYVVPFPLRNMDVIVGNNTFLANVPQTSLYDKVIEKFCQNFKDYNVIIALDESKNNDRIDFTTSLKSSLNNRGITNKTVAISDLNKNLNTTLSSYQKNIIVPASTSLITIGRILPVLRSLRTNSPNIDITMFGYPDWQAYSTQYLPDFFNHGVYIYSPFYADNNNPDVDKFNNRFRNWYNKTIINTYPKYALLGYDIGLYFISALKQKHNLLLNSTSTIRPMLQSTFYFEKKGEHNVNLNTGLFFIHYNKDMTVDKIDYSR